MKDEHGSLGDLLVTDLLREIFGSNLRVAGYQPILRREDYSVLVAHMVDPIQSVVVKLAGPRAALAAPFDRTLAINRLLCEKTSVPTPQVLAAALPRHDV